MVALFDIPGRLWAFGRKVEDLLAVQIKTERALEAVDSRLRTLEDRMADLEANQTHIVVEARSAASAAATTVAGAVLSDVVTRITRIEMRAESAVKRLPPSEGP